MSILSLIIKREFIAKVRNKSFIVMTFLSPLLFVGIAAFIGYLSSLKADVKRIAIHDETGIFAPEFKNTDEFHYLDLSKVDMKILKDSIMAESYEGLLYIPKTDSIQKLKSSVKAWKVLPEPSFRIIDKVPTLANVLRGHPKRLVVVPRVRKRRRNLRHPEVRQHMNQRAVT